MPVNTFREAVARAEAEVPRQLRRYIDNSGEIRRRIEELKILKAASARHALELQRKESPDARTTMRLHEDAEQRLNGLIARIARAGERA